MMGLLACLQDRVSRKDKVAALGEDIEQVDWDLFVVKGTMQELEKSYFRLTSAPDPSTVRPEPVLRRAYERLVHLLRQGAQNYFYALDQFKGMRQDCTVQHLRNDLTVRSCIVAASGVAVVQDFLAAMACHAMLCSFLTVLLPNWGAVPARVCMCGWGRQELSARSLWASFRHCDGSVAMQVNIYEAHARAALEYGDNAEYNQCQTQLDFLYRDARLPGCRAEFAAYRILYQTAHAKQGENGALLGTLRQTLHLVRAPCSAHGSSDRQSRRSK